jgi:hypothetical protein
LGIDLGRIGAIIRAEREDIMDAREVPNQKEIDAASANLLNSELLEDLRAAWRDAHDEWAKLLDRSMAGEDVPYYETQMEGLELRMADVSHRMAELLGVDKYDHLRDGG